jgi:hypothetical protein
VRHALEAVESGRHVFLQEAGQMDVGAGGSERAGHTDQDCPPFERVAHALELGLECAPTAERQLNVDVGQRLACLDHRIVGLIGEVHAWAHGHARCVLAERCTRQEQRRQRGREGEHRAVPP